MTGQESKKVMHYRTEYIRPAGQCRTSKAHVNQLGTYNLNEGEKKRTLQDTQPGGIGSLESILVLLKCLKRSCKWKIV
jgi:hypothetical protein